VILILPILSEHADDWPTLSAPSRASKVDVEGARGASQIGRELPGRDPEKHPSGVGCLRRVGSLRGSGRPATLQLVHQFVDRRIPQNAEGPKARYRTLENQEADVSARPHGGQTGG